MFCEKPIALTADEARLLMDCRERTGRHVAEAFMVRHHPQWQLAREIAQRPHRRSPRDADVFLLLPHGPQEHPQSGRHTAAAACTISAATQS